MVTRPAHAGSRGPRSAAPSVVPPTKLNVSSPVSPLPSHAIPSAPSRSTASLLQPLVELGALQLGDRPLLGSGFRARGGDGQRRAGC